MPDEGYSRFRQMYFITSKRLSYCYNDVSPTNINMENELKEFILDFLGILAINYRRNPPVQFEGK